MDTEVIDQATAEAALRKHRDAVDAAVGLSDVTTKVLRQNLMEIRPQGLLTVDEMAEAIGRNRNYVDSMWSTSGGTVKGKQTRVPVDGERVNPGQARKAYNELAALAGAQKRAMDAADTARAERDRTIVMIYQAKILGPGAIASYVGVDRNHVGRIIRRAGVKPIHRPDTRNQYTPAPATAA